MRLYPIAFLLVLGLSACGPTYGQKNETVEAEPFPAYEYERRRDA